MTQSASSARPGGHASEAPGRSEPADVFDVAIIGSGPTGCYTAIALRKLVPKARVAIFDGRLTPFGLTRYGIAADHQGMKGVSRQFDRLFAAPDVHFVGNTLVGRDISLEQLNAAFDVVVVATGLGHDRRIDVPHHPDARVFGAGEVLRYLNADPDSRLRELDEADLALGREVVVIGAGNVAMDLVRLLCKTEAGLAGSDIDDDARQALAIDQVERIHLLARGSKPRWDQTMFTELCNLPGVEVSFDGADVKAGGPSAGSAPAPTVVSVVVKLNETPLEIDYQHGQAHVLTQGSDDSARQSSYSADSVITAIGFQTASRDVNPLVRELSSQDVWVGGCHNGALGNLAENRVHAKKAAEDVVALLNAAGPRGAGGWSTVRRILPHATDFTDWTAIDKAEIVRARHDRLRKKFITRAEMSQVVTEHRASRTTDVPGPPDPA